MYWEQAKSTCHLTFKFNIAKDDDTSDLVANTSYLYQLPFLQFRNKNTINIEHSKVRPIIRLRKRDGQPVQYVGLRLESVEVESRSRLVGVDQRREPTVDRRVDAVDQLTCHVEFQLEIVSTDPGRPVNGDHQVELIS